MPVLSTGPVPQIQWGQIVRRGRDHQDPHSSKRPCIQGLTWAECFDMGLVGKRGATQTAAVLCTEGQAVWSISWQGTGSHLHAFLLWSRCQTPETPTDEFRLSSCTQTFVPVSLKKSQTKIPHVGTGLVCIRLLDCQCFGCI